MYRACKRDGKIDMKIGKKGVLLARRDTSLFIRGLYEKIITMIFDKAHRDDILYFILEQFNKLCSNSVSYKEFVITKSLGAVSRDSETNELILAPIEGVKTKVLIGNYKVPVLPRDAKKRAEQLKKKEATTDQEYYEKCLPAQVQLAEKMRKRGQIVQPGSRIEYLITDIENHKGRQYDKIEDMDYFLVHSSVLTVDFFYYMKIAINSVDEVLNIVFGQEQEYEYNYVKDFILQQYNFRYKMRRKVLEQLKSIFRPKIVIQ